MGAEGEEGAVEEVEHRHLVAAAVVSGVSAAARPRRPRLVRDDEQSSGGNWARVDMVELRSMGAGEC